MIFWGAIWGAVLAWFWPGHDSADLRVVIGAALGAAAGWSLLRAIRQELARHPPATPVAETMPAPQPVAPPARSEVPAPAPAPVRVAPPPVPTAAPTDSAPQPLPTRSPVPAPRAPRPVQPGPVQALFDRGMRWLLGGNTVVRLGVLVLFVGLAFLAKYAVENALIPPAVRLAAIAALGIALFVLGVRLRARSAARLGYALTLEGAGVAVLYLTVFAAYRLYQYLPSVAAFAALALVCLFSAIIAVRQDAYALAIIAFGGAFAAPVLVSTGQGSHVALFGYYLLLGTAITGIAWWKAWRALNLLGLVATFVVATAWGVLLYGPEDLASTEPFLVAFFLLYLVATLLYALRHGRGARAVDAAMVFGNPILAFGLQASLLRDQRYALAFSALAAGALYLALGWWLVRRRAGEVQVNRMLAECFGVLAFAFVTLAIPLAVDARWTPAAWALEGAAVYWMGHRQQRWLARLGGLLLQVLATLLFLGDMAQPRGDWVHVANPQFLGATLLGGAAMALAWWSRQPLPAPEGAGSIQRDFLRIEAALSPWLFWIAFLWWQGALVSEIQWQDAGLPTFSLAQRRWLHLFAWVLPAFALHPLALPRRRAPWPVAATPAWLALPWMLVAAVLATAEQAHMFRGGGWWAWPVLVGLHVVLLRRLDGGRPQAWWRWVHAGGVWLLALMLLNLLKIFIQAFQLEGTDWAPVMVLVAGSAVLAAFSEQRFFAAAAAKARWPLDRFADAYLWRAPVPIAVLLALGALVVAMHSPGLSRPLPYIPLLNPTDIAVALALAVTALWLQRVRASTLVVPEVVRGVAPWAVLAFLAFIAVNTVWLRVAHHWGGVAWDGSSLAASFLVQAGYSILWTVMALGLMVGAHRRGVRAAWMLGAGLLGATLVKLFLVDLSNRGGAERIVAFIAVGLLMLVVGWFAPLPPARPKPADAALEAA